MVESRAKRMKIVLTLAERAEEEAAKRVKEQADLLKSEVDQLQNLNAYSQQYVRSYGELRQGVTAREMMNYSGFINRLTDAIKEQESKIQRLQQGLDKLKAQWSITHQKRKALEDLIERFKKEESAVLERLLQKELDELANRPNGLC
jgi:flagellar protein FliJ